VEIAALFVLIVMEMLLDWEVISTTKFVSKEKILQKHSKKFLIIFLVKLIKFSALETALFLSTKTNKFIFQGNTHITVKNLLITRIIL